MPHFLYVKDLFFRIQVKSKYSQTCIKRGALKKIAPNGGRSKYFWGISCEKSRFYAKKSYFFQFQGGGACRVHPPWIHPCILFVLPFQWQLKVVDQSLLSISIYIEILYIAELVLVLIIAEILLVGHNKNVDSKFSAYNMFPKQLPPSTLKIKRFKNQII